MLALHAVALCFCARGAETGLPMPAIFDETITQVRKGEKIPRETLQQCELALTRYVADLHVENDVADPMDFLEADRMNYFMAHMKLEIAYPDKYLNQYRNWRLVKTCHEGFKRARLTDDSAFLTFCSIFSSLEQGDDAYTLAAYKELLEKDPFLARHTLKLFKNPNGRFLQLIKDLPKPEAEGK